MHEKAPVLSAAAREKIGSRYARRARGVGRLPAVMYGHGEDPVSITLDAKDALGHIHKGEKVFHIDLEGKTRQMVLLKGVQFDYLGTNIVHADFARASLKDRVRTKVPIHLVGEAVGLKIAGAVLIHPVAELDIECTLETLPEHIEVNISDLTDEHPITADKVPLPKGGRLLTDVHAIVAQIIIQKEEVVAPTAEAGAVAAQAQPEVITAKKPEEGGAPAAGDKAKPGAPAAKGGDSKKK